jgi:hypothetical protein
MRVIYTFSNVQSIRKDFVRMEAEMETGKIMRLLLRTNDILKEKTNPSGLETIPIDSAQPHQTKLFTNARAKRKVYIQP